MNIGQILFYGIFVLLLLFWIKWRRKKLSIFKELGIPGPPPHFLFGNILELNKKGPFKCEEEWIEKYGKILGFYNGMTPVLLVADPELLRKIFIKDFHLFSIRPDSVPLRVHSCLDHIIPASKIMDSLLTNLKGRRWKDVRSILSHTFSATKLKMMIPAINKLVDIAISILEEKCHNKEAIDIHEHFKRLTLDMVCAQAFAMDVDCQNNPDHPFLSSAKVIFDLPFDSKIVFLGRCFPELGVLAMALNFLKMLILNKGRIPPLEITNVLEKIIQMRRKNPSMRKPDLLQLLIDASISDTENGISTNKTENLSDLKKTHKNLTLSDLEIKSNALVVFLAGYETTSTALAFAFHFLALFPQLQEKIQAEIDHTLAAEGHLNYYNVNHFQFMERFLLETMRFYPPAAIFQQRITCADVDYGSIQIPKGMQITVPVNYIHHTDEFWHHPEVFDPDRFLLENATTNSTVNYWAFGVGPRNCIGTRLVHLTTKVVMAKILNKFTIKPVHANTKESIPCKIKMATIEPYEVPVMLELRSPKKDE